jgi:hypothetical protein
MSMTVRQVRQRVGRELGLILTGVATGATGTTLIDTSSDSPLDAGDSAVRLNGAGILIHVVGGGGATHYRANVTYTPSTQTITWVGAVASIATGDSYEIHLEPVLNPLLNWPDLIEDALKTIKRYAMEEILLTDRDYYDLDDWRDIAGVEQIRRLYDVGSNYLENADFNQWTLGAAAPVSWTVGAGIVSEVTNTRNYRTASVGSAGILRQDANVQGPRRVRGVVHSSRVAGGSSCALSLDVRSASSSIVEVLDTDSTTATGTPFRLEAEVEVMREAAKVRVSLTAGGGACNFRMPLLYDLSAGQMRRIQPITPLDFDDELRLYVPAYFTVARMALMLPYTVPTDDGLTVVSSTLNDQLLIAAIAVQVIRWLIEQPQIPDKGTFGMLAGVWDAKFRKRHKEHMRKIAKTPQMWEAGELTGSTYIRREIGGRR